MLKKKRVVAFLLALVMLLGLAMPTSAMADGEDKATEPENTTKTVTLHKLLMSKEDLAKWDSDKVEEKGYNGTQDLKGLQGIVAQVDELKTVTLKEIKGVYFAFQYADGDNLGQYVTYDATQEEGKQYGATLSLDDEHILGGLTGDSGFEFHTEGLKGKFQIVEVPEKSTYIKDDGSVLADQKAVPVVITLPLVNKKGVVQDAHVYPKNTEDKPQIDKNFAAGTEGTTEGTNNGAEYKNYKVEKDTINRRINEKVPYDVKTLIPAGSRYQKLVWNDIMEKELTFNKDLQVKATYKNDAEPAQDVDLTLAAGTDYTVLNTDHGFVLTFKASGLEIVNAITKEKKDVTIQLSYTAKLNSDAAMDKPYENKITLDYGNKPNEGNEPTEGKPSNKQITVTKNWAKDGQEVTDADKDVTVRYYLQEKVGDIWNDVASYTVTGATKLEDFNHTFEGLDDSKTYRVLEQVSGYAPEYSKLENGQLTIVNKKDSTNPKPLEPTSPKVETYGKKFVKTNEESDALLAGAKFIVKTKVGEKDMYLAIKDDAETTGDAKAYETAEKAYQEAFDALKAILKKNEKDQTEDEKTKLATYNGDENTTGSIKQLEKARDAAFKKAQNNYQFVENKDLAVKFTSSYEKGHFEVTGLKAGTYYLEETQAPEGYATLSGDIEFQVGKNSYTSQGDIGYEPKDGNKPNTDGTDAMQIKNKKVSIPQTGGMGTALFIGAGLLLMVGAGFVYLKNRKEEQAAL